MGALEALKRFDTFIRLSDKGKEELIQGLSLINCAASASVLYKGDTVSGAYLVLTGRLRVFTLTPNGNEATLYFIDPGETCVLALNCLFNNLLYPAWVEAETTTTVAHIPGTTYRSLFEREPTIQNMTVQTLSTLVFRLMGELEMMHSCHHKQRLANFIVLHTSSLGSLKMTQQQLARHLGTTREVVARLLQEFSNKGYIQTKRGELLIKDMPGLRNVITEKKENSE